MFMESLVAEVDTLARRFTSVDDAMAEAARLLLQKHNLPIPATNGTALPDTGLGSIGSMRDAAAELDEIVADAYRQRREDKGRVFDFE